MHVHCPHCHQRVELVENGGLEHIDCPSCGSHFSLLGEETAESRTGNQAAALDAYAQGLKVTWYALPFLASDRFDFSSNWHEVLVARLLCRRAEQQLFGREQTDEERFRNLAQTRTSADMRVP